MVWWQRARMLEPNCGFVVLPLANGHVTLSKLLNSMLELLYLQHVNNISTYLTGLLLRIKQVSVCKALLRVPGRVCTVYLFYFQVLFFQSLFLASVAFDMVDWSLFRLQCIQAQTNLSQGLFSLCLLFAVCLHICIWISPSYLFLDKFSCGNSPPQFPLLL